MSRLRIAAVGLLVLAYLWWQGFKELAPWLLLLVLVLMLSGCARPPASIVPASLLQCAPQPKSPADKVGVTQPDVALFVVDLAAAGDDCRSKLGSVRRILVPEN
jgi:hypothetical protein